MEISAVSVREGKLETPDESSTSFQAAKRAINAISEERLMAWHTEAGSKSKSVSTTIRTLVGEELSRSRWRQGLSPIGDIKTARAMWTLSFSQDASVIQIAFGNRESMFRHLVLPLIASKSYWRAEGGTSTDCTVLAPTQGLCETGGFDRACGTDEDLIQAAVELTRIVDWSVNIVGLLGLQAFELKQFTGKNNRLRSRMLHVK